ncbi:MAG: hypothetical protein FGM15_01820 [Chthoniobacterales bacterium]|nr:hypothetical protein [Chthoniobacterales bacterium]
MLAFRFAVVLAVALAWGCAPRSGRVAGADIARGELQTRLAVQPADFSLAERREIEAVYSVVNTGRRTLRLDFPTGQRVEFAVRAPDGRQIFLWSEDQPLSPVPSTLMVNPGEKVEYEASLPTRDMAAGRSYTAIAFVPGRPDSVAEAILLPR